jgi:hypothetical protein
VLLVAGSTIHARPDADALSDHRVQGFGGRIRIVHDFAHPLKRLLYASADVFVSPVDNIQESFGLTLIEAMASRLPVIASDWSGYREIVRDGQEGFLVETYVDPGGLLDASALAGFASTPIPEFCAAQRTVVSIPHLAVQLERLLADADLRLKMGSAGHERVKQQYVWSRLIRRLDDFWSEQVHNSNDRLAERPAILDLKRAFRDYATPQREGVLQFVYANPAELADYAKRNPYDKQGIAVLKLCTEKPRLICEISRHGHGVAATVYRLLKQGCLHQGLPAR